MGGGGARHLPSIEGENLQASGLKKKTGPATVVAPAENRDRRLSKSRKGSNPDKKTDGGEWVQTRLFNLGYLVLRFGWGGPGSY